MFAGFVQALGMSLDLQGQCFAEPCSRMDTHGNIKGHFNYILSSVSNRGLCFLLGNFMGLTLLHETFIPQSITVRAFRLSVEVKVSALMKNPPLGNGF